MGSIVIAEEVSELGAECVGFSVDVVAVWETDFVLGMVAPELCEDFDASEDFLDTLTELSDGSEVSEELGVVKSIKDRPFVFGFGVLELLENGDAFEVLALRKIEYSEDIWPLVLVEGLLEFCDDFDVLWVVDIKSSDVT